MANSNNDWSHFYNNNQSLFTTTASTVTRTTSTATSTDSPESRRVSKPTRRRSRASRRTPTTLFNTDTANFRAMVQQFTGGPSAVAFGSSSSSGFSQTSTDPTAGVSSVGYHQQAPSPWQYANIQNQTPRQELLQQERPYMISSSDHLSNVSYPNAAVSNAYVAANERRVGERYAPSSERNSSNVNSWLQ